MPNYDSITPPEENLERWAAAEGELMAEAPELDARAAARRADRLKHDPTPTNSALSVDGVVRIDGLISCATANALLENVNAALSAGGPDSMFGVSIGRACQSA